MKSRVRTVRTLHATQDTEVLEIELTGNDMSRRLALKRTRASAPDAVRKRLRHEAKVGMQLNHPHLGAVLDFDVVSGQPTLLIPLVDGVRLDSILAELPKQAPAIPPEYVLSWARDVGAALMYLHTRQTAIIHNDISPSNVMIGHHGHVKLIDFGTSVFPSAPDLSPPDETYGTVGFMAPEQLMGETPGPETDIFALGCIVHYALTGTTPEFSIESAARVRIHSGIEEPIRQLLAKALMFHRKRRLADAEVFATACDTLIDQVGRRPLAWEIGRWTQSIVEQTKLLNRPRKGPADLLLYEVSEHNVDSRRPRRVPTAVHTAHHDSPSSENDDG